MEEQNNYIETYIKKFAEKRSRIVVLIFAVISVICSFLFMTENKLNAFTTLYTILMLAAGIASIIYVTDIYDRNKYRNDVLIGGITLNLIGILLRIIKIGLAFSVRFFVGYCAFGVAVILLIIKLSKNKVKEKGVITLFLILSFYCIFEFFYANISYISGFFSAIYRIAEATLFINYIGILIMNKTAYQEFSDNVNTYKMQIPSLKICFSIYVIFIVLIIGIGAMKNLDKIHIDTNVVQKNETIQKNDTEEKSEKVEKNEKITSTVAETESKTTPTQEPIQTISLGEKVTTDNFEFTLNKVVLSYNVEPDNPPSYYTYYAASDGQVYIYVNASVKNLTQKNIRCDEVYSVTANYNNGYKYNGFNIVSDTDGDFTYANINSINPLQTMGVHCLVDCPKEVETSENPLNLTIKLRDGKEFLYTIR